MIKRASMLEAGGRNSGCGEGYVVSGGSMGRRSGGRRPAEGAGMVYICVVKGVADDEHEDSSGRLGVWR